MRKGMAAQPSPLTIQEFHKLYDGAKPAYEYWFGQAVQKSMPTLLHGVVRLIIATLLEKSGWNTSLEVRLKVVLDAEPVPDVIAIRGKFKGPYPTTAPELCIEILSPRDTLPKALEKAKQYISWECRCVWIIDPEKRTAWTLTPEQASEPTWISPSGVLQIGNTVIELDVLFSEVDRKLDAPDSQD